MTLDINWPLLVGFLLLLGAGVGLLARRENRETTDDRDETDEAGA